MIKPKTLLVGLVALAVVVVIAVVSVGQTNKNVRKGETPQVKEAQTNQTPIFKDITVAQASDLVKNNADNPAFNIIDVRTASEYATGHLAKAVNIDYYSTSFRDDLAKLDKNKSYLIYCRTGGRSAKTSGVMKELGFNEVYNLLGGITSWTGQGLSTVR